ncbi:MAG: redoxin domain-containing protein [Chloroflexi bacterium]|nr:redoxin domain-containing protein [Chloroflexota bacterium]
MPQTLISGDRTTVLAGATSEGDALWVPVGDLEPASGWTLKPEGACRGEECVPIPRGQESLFVRPGLFNLAALAGYLGQPVVHDARRNAWVIGESAGRRAAGLDSLEAPDFTLPDLQGNLHSLHDYRGKKVFLVSWASW